MDIIIVIEHCPDVLLIIVFKQDTMFITGRIVVVARSHDNTCNGCLEHYYIPTPTI